VPTAAEVQSIHGAIQRARERVERFRVMNLGFVELEDHPHPSLRLDIPEKIGQVQPVQHGFG
jgi:hypothetical protein